MNDNTSMGNGASQQNHPNGQWQGQPGQQGQGQYGQYGQPQGGYQQGPPQGGWQQAPQPKKKNWFLRHKILTAILALFLIGGIAAATSGGGGSNGSDTASNSDNSSGSEKKKDEKKSEALPKVGTAIKDGDLEFTVTKVEPGVASVGDQYLGEKAQGAFTLVHVSVKNVGTQTQTVMADGQKAYDAKGIGYEANSTASIYVKNNDTFFTEINPGNTLQGVFVFDAPKGIKLTKVRLHESMFSNGVEGSL
ncbi:DUF4352 domain-containing protein [Dermacoccus abyssi]|uniref:DUF4352 domain-containing protein n=1 Tax=Dermacoccus abyssi TaxID=322596 RepID=A0ABX5ZBG0_9MICO|nr:DUF4352 domain-containing protein [Dermacoccus abyssi]